MAEVVAEGEVVLHARENVRAALAKAEAAFERTMEKLDGQEAELKIKAEMLDFDRKAKEAQAKLDELDKKKATVTIDADTKKIDEAIAKEQANLKKLELANTRLNNQQRKLTQERLAANEKLYNEMEKGEKHVADVADRESKRAADAHKKSQDQITKQQAAATRARITSTIQEQQAREKAEIAASRVADREAKARQRVVDREAAQATRALEREASNRERISASSNRLERQYIDLIQKRQRLGRAGNKVFLPQSERLKIDFDIKGVDEQIAEIEAKLALIGKPPPEVKVHIEADERGADSLGRFLTALTSTTVRLGPFTTTIAGAVRGLALLGPIITGVVGSLGALAAAVGSAALGFGGALTAGVGAFGLVLGSTAGLLPGLLRDFKNLNTMQDAYHKQVLKTGAGSDKAKTKLKEFNHALGEVSPSAREAFNSFDKLQDSYRKLSQQARTPFLSTMNEGFKTARTLLSRFGPEALQSFSLVARGAKAAIRALRGPEAAGIIGTLFDNGQKALPAFARGLGNLAASAARVAAAFSRMLAPLGSGFENWTKRFSNFTKDSSRLNRFVDNTTNSMKSLGHLLQSTGGFLTSFFSAGVGPGVQLMDRMAGGIDKITSAIRRNPQGLGNFFSESVDTAERLYGVLQPLASLFMEWATILRPFSNLILSVTGSIGSLVAGLAGFGPTRGLIQAAFAVFLGGTLISKIRNVTGAIQALSSSMGALGARQTALRTSSALTGGALAPLGRGATTAARGVTTAEGIETAAIARPVRTTAARSGSRVAAGIIDYEAVGAGAARSAPAIEKTAVAMGRGAKAASALRLGLTGVGAVLGGGEVLGGAAVAVAALGTAYYFATKGVRANKKAYEESASATQRTAAAYRAGATSVADFASQSERAGLTVREAQRQLRSAKKGTDDYKWAQLNLRDAQRQSAQSQVQLQSSQKENIRLSDEQAKRAQTELTNFDKTNAGRRKLNKTTMESTGPANDEYKNAVADNIRLDAERAKKVQAVTAALNRSAAASANNARGLKGFLPVLGQAEQQLGAYARQAGKAAATKIGVKFQDSGDAGRVAAAAGRAIKNGVPKSVATRVAVSTGDAETSIKRINAAKLTPKKLTIVESGGQKAIHTVQQLTGLKLPKQIQHIISEGGPKALGMLSTLLGFKLPGKTQALQEQGGAQILGMISRIAGTKIPNKTMSAILHDLASGKISSIIGLINSIPGSRTSTITVNHVDVYRRINQGGGDTGVSASGKVHGHAAGGIMAYAAGGSRRLAGYSYTSPVLNRTISNALATASKLGARQSKGGKFARPQLLVGEQNKPEYVIATNPAYRQRNKGILAAAAKRLGMNVTPAATGAYPGGGTFSSKGGGYTADLTAPTTKGIPKAIDAKTLRRKSTKIKGKKRYAFKTNRSWAAYIANLHTRQDQLEREVSIREGEVREPADMVVQDTPVAVKDPTTGEITQVPQFKANPKITSEYMPDLQSVLDAVAALKQVVSALVSGIPQAITANQTEQSYRQSAVHTLHNEIVKENKRTGLKGDAKSKHESRLRKLKDEYDKETGIVKDLKTDEKSLFTDRVEAGFDFREVEDKRVSLQTEKDQALGNANTDAATQSAQELTSANGGGGGGSGSGGDTGPTLSQQTGLADTERANILKSFGGNAGALTAAGAANFGMGGAQRNAGSLNPNGGAGFLDPQASTTGASAYAGAGGGSLASAMAGGAKAANMLGAAGVGGAQAAVATLGGTAGGTVNNITNNFAAPPPDPHTWTQGVAFETAAIL